MTNNDNDVAAGLFAIARALDRLATHVKYLGVGSAASEMGAIEFLRRHTWARSSTLLISA